MKCFDQWSIEQMQDGIRCRVEGSITCIPLRRDPICYRCYELDRESHE